MSHNLGPDRPLISLSTWDEVEAAAAAGLLRENAYCELKAHLPDSNAKSNMELARDLAALAVDGGLFIIGIKDSGEVIGVPSETLDGLKARISHVTQASIKPMLALDILDPLMNPDGNRAVLIVSVPPSHTASHMADGQYWGRSSHGKQTLTDEAVRRLISTQTERKDTFETRLLALPGRDQMDRFVRNPEPAEGRFYFLAEPCASFPSVADPVLRPLIGSLKTKAHSSPLRGTCGHEVPDSKGEVLSSTPANDQPQVPGVTHVVRLVEATGNLEMFSRPITYPTYSPGMTDVVAVIALLHQAIELTGLLSEKVGYSGQWRVGLHLTGLLDTVLPQNCQEEWPASHHRYVETRFTDPDYTQTLVIGTPRDLTAVGEATETMLRGIKRGYGYPYDLVDLLG